MPTVLSTPTLAERAVALMRANDRGTYTVPSPRLYPHQWAWDSAFAAIGWLRIDPARALTELQTLMAGQWSDGRIPHIFFHQPSGDYFPTPETWGRKDSSTITQPPIWAVAARKLLEAGVDEAAIARLLPAIDRSHRFFAHQRDPKNWGLVAVTHPWESGLDNSPSWDAPMKAIDPDQAPPFQRVDKHRVKDPAERPSDEDYKRYIVMVKQIEASGFGMSAFQVYDPLMTAILAKAEQDLAWMAQQLGVPTYAAARAARLTQALLDRLWDDEAGRFRFWDAAADVPVDVDILAAYMPLILDAVPAEQKDRMVRTLRTRYWTEAPLPSTSPEAPYFEPRRYWRGPSWINMNWLLAPAVGTDLRDKTLALLERNDFWEYFHPHTGEPLGAPEFMWSAALALDWLHEAR